MTTKLTKSQRALLEMMAESNNGISVYEAQAAGSGGLGLSNLAKRGWAYSSRYANGQLWSITDEGRAVLEAAP